jgi:hypothetical protein
MSVSWHRSLSRRRARVGFDGKVEVCPFIVTGRPETELAKLVQKQFKRG